ncbi:MAG TPA: cupredoxin domain-containing protein [Chloroflexota bacterium]
MKRFALTSSLLAVVLVLGVVPAAAAQTVPQTAAVTINDTKFDPSSVTIVAGGWVTWTNTGNNVHTVTAAAGVPINLDSGGLGNGQSFTFAFPKPGTYNYTSETDCLNFNYTPGFDCTGGKVNVLPAGARAPTSTPPSPLPAPPSPPSPSPQVSAQPSAGPAGLVTVDDKGFSPPVVNVKAGQAVTWFNQGSVAHTASAAPGTGQVATGIIFDTRGFSPGQSVSLVFQNPGTYAYTSATDCLNGNNNPQFACGKSYLVIVSA